VDYNLNAAIARRKACGGSCFSRLSLAFERGSPAYPPKLSIPPNNKLVAFCFLLRIILIIVRESAVEKFDQNPSPSIKKQFYYGTKTS